MNFVHGIIIAVGLLVAANLVMISADLEAGNIIDYVKEPATLDMVESGTMETLTPVPDEMHEEMVEVVDEPEVVVVEEAVMEPEPEVTVEVTIEELPNSDTVVIEDTASVEIVEAEESTTSEVIEEPVMAPIEGAVTEAEVMLGIGSGVPGCEATDECYIPHTVTIAVGGTVTWINDDAGHTVTAGDIDEDPNSVGIAFPNGFDSGFFLAGNNYAHTFEEAGEYPYYCMVHPWMQGVVIVQ